MFQYWLTPRPPAPFLRCIHSLSPGSGDMVPLQAVAAAVPLRPGKRHPIVTHKIHPILCSDQYWIN
jgi:hypothetical protein